MYNPGYAVPFPAQLQYTPQPTVLTCAKSDMVCLGKLKQCFISFCQMEAK